jgi:hypothetical protein
MTEAIPRNGRNGSKNVIAPLIPSKKTIILLQMGHPTEKKESSVPISARPPERSFALGTEFAGYKLVSAMTGPINTADIPQIT